MVELIVNGEAQRGLEHLLTTNQNRVGLSCSIFFESQIKQIALRFGEQEIAFLHADWQILGGIFEGRVIESYRLSITFFNKVILR